jgi:signal transduction histidine kinase/ActR/RegA family two-component response regulator
MPPMPAGAEVQRASTSQELLAAQLRLLYTNANLSAGINFFVATVLCALQWAVISHIVLGGWWLSIGLITLFRLILASRYRHAPDDSELLMFRRLYVLGAAINGAVWGAAGVLLYPAEHIVNQVFLTFVVGGMMLGAASLLAPRPEAFLSFQLPAGLIPAVRFLAEGDKTHVGMGLLAVLFTLAIVVTTRRLHRTICSSLLLQIENRGLTEDLRTANQALELRVQERTAELHKSTEQLRAEIAQREQTEEELLRARKLESLGVLAGGIAHDFNNFLTVMLGNLEVAQAQLDPDQPAQDFLVQAANACQRAKSLASQLLTFAKGGAPVRRVVPIAQLVTDAVYLARTGSPIPIDVRIARDLGFAEVDPGQIGQVLHNILINAREAMPRGGAIEVRADNLAVASEPQITISIRDSGHGIPADVLPQIFDPYFTTKAGGNGLGLATSYAIVNKHGGHIDVESTPGIGTVFTIFLPAAIEPPAAEACLAPIPEKGAERVLIMDDDEALRTLCKAVLNHLGYEAYTASDGAEAIACYETAKATGKAYDAVLLDLTVTGGMGGIEAAEKLKELDPAVKLIVSSGYSDAPAMSRFAEYGFEAVLVKPWTVKEMSEVLRRVLTPNTMQAPR